MFVYCLQRCSSKRNPGEKCPGGQLLLVNTLPGLSAEDSIAALKRLVPSVSRHSGLATEDMKTVQHAIEESLRTAKAGGVSVLELNDGWNMYVHEVADKAMKQGLPLNTALLYVPFTNILQYVAHEPQSLYNVLTQFGVMFKGVEANNDQHPKALEKLSRRQLQKVLEKAQALSKKMVPKPEAEYMHETTQQFLLSALNFHDQVDEVQVVPRVPYDMVINLSELRSGLPVAFRLLEPLKAFQDHISVTQKAPLVKRSLAKTSLKCPACQRHQSAFPYEAAPICGQCLDRQGELLLAGTNAICLGGTRSEAIEIDVVQITDANFTEVVLRSDAHVLLDVYAPWCPYCLKLEPLYEKLPLFLKDRLGFRPDKVIVAKMDGTVNDRLRVPTYPTILFYKKGHKTNPVTYDGEAWSTEDIGSWAMGQIGAGLSVPPWLAAKPLEMEEDEKPKTPSVFDTASGYSNVLLNKKNWDPAPLPSNVSLRRKYFNATYGEKYGHDGQIARLREQEFSRFHEMIYLDSTGSGLYQESQIKEVGEMLRKDVYGNTHSLCECSRLTQREVDRARAKILRFMKTDVDEYQIAFVHNASAALKTVGENFPFDGPTSAYIYTLGNHNSVLGIREYAIARGALVFPVTDKDLATLITEPEEFFASRGHKVPTGPTLFAFPGEDNFNGKKYPLELVQHVKSAIGKNCYVLLDAAALAPNSTIDLERFKPDFLCISFYKMFGYPTGVGALIMKADAATKLKRVYFAGGTVSASTSGVLYHDFKEGPEKFEDGTLPFLSIASLRFGLERLQRLTITSIHNHTWCLAHYLAEGLVSLRHANGRKVIELYGKHGSPYAMDIQGPIISFNVLDNEGAYRQLCTVLSAMSDARFQVRTGEMCNPGSCFSSIGIDEETVASMTGKNGCGTEDFIDGKPIGAVRASIGYFNTFEDVDGFYTFVKATFVN